MAEGFRRDEGTDTTGRVREATARARETAADTGREMMDRVVEKKDELKQRASGMVDEQRRHVATRVDAISRALHGAADSLRGSGEQQLSNWVDQAAGQVERMVGYMQGQPADGMLDDFEDLARRNPALFLGGTYLAGMAVGRFLRASSPRPEFGERGAISMPETAATPIQHGYPGRGTGSTMERGYSERTTAMPGTPGTPWTGVGVAPSVVGGAADRGTGGVTAPGSTRRPFEPSSTEPGMTDEDLRAAWHGTPEGERGSTRSERNSESGRERSGESRERSSEKAGERSADRSFGARGTSSERDEFASNEDLGDVDDRGRI